MERKESNQTNKTRIHHLFGVENELSGPFRPAHKILVLCSLTQSIYVDEDLTKIQISSPAGYVSIVV